MPTVRGPHYVDTADLNLDQGDEPIGIPDQYAID
jgi:hypothetical protein